MPNISKSFGLKVPDISIFNEKSTKVLHPNLEPQRIFQPRKVPSHLGTTSGDSKGSYSGLVSGVKKDVNVQGSGMVGKSVTATCRDMLEELNKLADSLESEEFEKLCAEILEDI